MDFRCIIYVWQRQFHEFFKNWKFFMNHFTFSLCFLLFCSNMIGRQIEAGRSMSLNWKLIGRIIATPRRWLVGKSKPAGRHHLAESWLVGTTGTLFQNWKQTRRKKLENKEILKLETRNFCKLKWNSVQTYVLEITSCLTG